MVNQETPSAQAVLQVVRALDAELHHARSRMADVRLDSTLEADLGFDSLARIELLSRLEQRLKVRLPDTILGTVDTVADLVQAVSSAALVAEVAPFPIPATALAGKIAQRSLPAGAPTQATTLQEVLGWRLQRHPDATHLVLLGDQQASSLSYQGLHDGARRVADQLRSIGVAPGSTVALMLPTGFDYFYAFFGALLAGAIPVPIYPPLRASQLEEHVRRYAVVLANARAQVLITVPEAAMVARLLRSQVPTLKHVLSVAGSADGERSPLSVPTPASDSIALLQYTSGSTGAPQGCHTDTRQRAGQHPGHGQADRRRRIGRVRELAAPLS